ncbi:MAG: esterase family protein [Chitinophagaceae bacterium]|nr:esterase family protein [Chitinophagaceae bacterium]
MRTSPGLFKWLLALVLLSGALPGWAARVDSVLINSRAMQRPLPMTFVLPNSYDSSSTRYPVLYLLHGYGGWHSNWILRMPGLTSLADIFQVIIICPEGGRNSWYVNSPLQPQSQFETFVAEEVTDFVDSTFRTRNQPQYRAISGLSMGGHGALYIAMRHRQLFGLAGSMSGAVDLTQTRDGFGLSSVIGDSTGWHRYSVLHLADSASMAGLQLILDCGLDDRLLPGNRALHQQWLNLRVPHVYMERPGGHTWDYWRASIWHHLVFFSGYWSSISG